MAHSTLGRNVSANLLSNAWSTLLALALTPVYVALLGVESYGLIGFHLSWLTILSILDAAISSVAVRELAWRKARAEDAGELPSFYATLELAYWGVVLAVAMVGLPAAWLWGADWFKAASLPSQTVREALVLMLLALVFQLPGGFYLSGMVGLQRQVESSALTALFGTVRGAGAALVLWLLVADLRAFFAWQLLSSMAQTWVMRRAVWRSIGDAGGQSAAEATRRTFSSRHLASVREFAGGMLAISAAGVAMTQADKLLVSHLVPLAAVGHYMLAWAVASGLTRVATPLIQAFAPRFTELAATGEHEELGRQLRRASQTMSAMMLPPAIVIALAPQAVLFAWTGNAELSASAATALGFMVAGTALTTSSYPPLSVLYSLKRMRPVLIFSAVSLVLFLPLLYGAVARFGIIGGSVFWGGYGLVSYLVYQFVGRDDIGLTKAFVGISRDFLAPAVAALAVAWAVRWLIQGVQDRFMLVAILVGGVAVGWMAAILACPDLRTHLLRRI